MKQLALLLTPLLVMANSVQADQLDPRLDGFFDALNQAEDRAEIYRIEREIWETWRIAPDEKTQQIFSDGMEAMHAADFKVAIEHFTAAIALDPNFAEAYNMRATTHFLLGNLFESLTDVEATIDLEPRHFGALMGGAQIAIRSGQADLALEFVEAALEVSPNKADWLVVAERLRKATGAIDL